MIKMLKNEFDSRTETLTHYPHINEIFFMTLIVLCFIGDLLGDVSGRGAIFYWIFMVPVFFLITLVKEKARELKTGRIIEDFMRTSFLYWLSALISILLVMFLWHADALNAVSASLASHVIVAQTMFLLGTIAGVRFYLIGLFLFLTAGITTQFEGVFGFTILIALPIIFFGFYYDKHKSTATAV
ncbi:hypothetical protein AU255_14340 [Methyloprofundus sedimenti]|uniref:Uncharacterized protein n=2 Tax=Methyloprofundus sedimenti TaxID=1420851 RepID=A0A1V8M427_9GAMM|nr:hypothetical protein AU255_14340 [Methyloprofundus sedimenti]